MMKAESKKKVCDRCIMRLLINTSYIFGLIT